MNDFWNNISRYPRFFISSVIGLTLIIITPFRNLFKIPKLRIFLIFCASAHFSSKSEKLCEPQFLSITVDA